MVERSIRVVLRANVADFNAQIKSSSRTLDDLVKNSDRSGAAAQTMLGRLAQSAELQREQWNQMGNAMLGAGTLLAVGVGSAVVKFAAFDEKMSHVQAATHETAANMGQLREAALQAGKDTAYSASEAAGAIESLAKAGVSTADILSGGLRGSLDLAAAGGLDVADAADIASAAMNQFTLRGDQVGHVADLLAAGASKAMGSVNDLGMALKQGGLVAAQTGLSIEETVGGLSAFASNALLGSDAGTSFKTMLQRLNPQSKEASILMDELGLRFYDADGKFVGLAETAGQLRTALGGMSAEQRNAALNTLFGADAVRAASVLYSEGGDGIQKWIDKVNDSGYASKTAAARMDNLKGDVEKLMGSIETVLLRGGSGVNKSLRSIVKSADALVDALGEIPPEVFSSVGVISSFAAANLLARGALLKVVPLLIDMKKAFNGLDTSVPFVARMSSGLSNLRGGLSQTASGVKAFGETFVIARANGVSNIGALTRSVTPMLQGAGRAASGFGSALLGAVGGPAGLAITVGLAAITYAVTSYAQAQAEANARAEEYAALLDVNGKLSSKAALEQVAKNLQESGALDALEKIGVKASVGVRAVVDEKEFAKLRAQLKKREQTLNFKVGSPQAADAARIKGETELYREQVAELESVRSALAALDAESGAIGKAAANHSQMQRAMEGVSDAADDQADSFADVTVAAEEQAKQLEKLLEAQSDLAGIVLSSRQAQRQFEESLDEAQEAINKSIESLGMEADWLDITTEAGRKNQAALDDIAKASWDLLKARHAEGAKEEELQAIMKNSREQFIAVATQMGMNSTEAEKLADKLGLIPENVKTVISQSGAAETTSAAQGVNNELRRTPSGKNIHFSTSGVYETIADLRYLAEVQRSVGPSVRVAMGPGGRGGYTLAEGGAVIGPGTETSDSIPAMLSNGEHVLTASDVRKAGGHAAIYRLRQALQSGRVPRFATGGAVGKVPSSLLQSSEVRVVMPDRFNLFADDGTFLGVFRGIAAGEAIRVAKKAGL